MLMAGNSYPGKILLFGEYSILYGSDAVLVPYRKVHAGLVYGKTGSESNQVLLAFHEYLCSDSTRDDAVNLSDYIDLIEFRSEIGIGLSIDSSIPWNKGIGSSGAICAAVFGAFCHKKTDDPYTLKQIFSKMESWFHGKSSGIDPLCIYLNKPLFVINNEYLPQQSEVFMNNIKPFLIDTGIQSKTKPLVEYFSSNMTREDFADEYRRNYLPLVNGAVDQLLKGSLIIQTVIDIAKAQQKYFDRMIPDSYKEVWEQGIKTGLYGLKICGSGGGGMILGFTEDIQGTVSYLKSQFNISAEEI